jgi:8-oxo-dGTP diphosphatase
MAQVGVILEDRNNRLLLQLRDDNVNYPNQWGLFGGHIESNEKPLQAAIREIYEELGIKLKKEELKFLFCVKIDNKNYFVFRTKFLYDISKIKLKEGKDLKFFSKEEISKLENLIPGIRKFEKIYWELKEKSI